MQNRKKNTYRIGTFQSDFSDKIPFIDHRRRYFTILLTFNVHYHKTVFYQY